ncbi:MAG: histidinol-phosphate transaminase [Candidatus Eisenbacteria bacterium]|nr:histidinol-phosphate transaminase [Candidatus Eisenbacteria bacterium]
MLRGPEIPDYVRGMMVYVPGKPIEEVRRELGIKDEIIKLASNENPLGPSPLALEAMRRALPELHRYPDGGGFYLRKAIAERFKLGMERVILGNGSTDIIEMIARAHLADGDEAVFSQQSFVMYPIAVASVNGRGVAVPATADRRHDLDAMAAAIGPKTKLVYIANPSNPTGTYVTRTEMDRFLDRIPENVLVAVDEAYHEYVEPGDYPDCLDDVRAGRNVIVLRTFSKIYGLAGIRAGYAFASEETIANLNQIRSPFNISHLAQVAGLAALEDEPWAARCRAQNIAELAFLHAELGRRKIAHTPSVANFILIEPGRDIQPLFLDLQKRGVIIRPMGGPGLANCARVTVGTRAENIRLLQALDDLLAADRK